MGPSSAAVHVASRFGHATVGLPSPSVHVVVQETDSFTAAAALYAAESSLPAVHHDAEAAAAPALALVAPSPAVVATAADGAPEASSISSISSGRRRLLSSSSSSSSGRDRSITHSVYGSSPIGWRLRACVGAKANLGPNGNGASLACRNAIDSAWDPEAARVTPSALAEMVLTPLQRLRSGSLADMLQHFVFVVPKVNE